jgi:hypothetical protein
LFGQEGSMALDEEIFTKAVSFPTPALAPVTMATFPVKSGMSSVLNLEAGGKAVRKADFAKDMGE